MLLPSEYVWEQDELVCVNFECHILYLNAKIVIFIELEHWNRELWEKLNSAIPASLNHTINACIFVFDSENSAKKVRHCRVKMKQKLSCSQPEEYQEGCYHL